jgi:osmotically-inducible protein OsmY
MRRKQQLRLASALVIVLGLILPTVVAGADSQSDERITSNARSALQRAAGVRASAVGVDTSQGRVTLYGKVATERAKASASEQVRQVAGVLQIRNVLQIVTPGDLARVQRSDDAVKRDIRRLLRADPSLGDSRITVRSVDDGVVILSGDAASSGDMVRALSLADGRPGVRRIFSEIEALPAHASSSEPGLVGPRLEIATTIRNDAIDSDDDVIRHGVERALSDLGPGDDADVHVAVKDGVVWLTGSVPTWQGNSSRISAARSVTGVRSIVNGLRVAAVRVATR